MAKAHTPHGATIQSYILVPPDFCAADFMHVSIGNHADGYIVTCGSDTRLIAVVYLDRQGTVTRTLSSPRTTDDRGALAITRLDHAAIVAKFALLYVQIYAPSFLHQI